MNNLNVIIVGAGIGGLQTALALATDGHKVTVLETVKQFLEVCIATPVVFFFELNFGRLVLAFEYLRTLLVLVALGVLISARSRRKCHAAIASWTGRATPC